MSQSRLFAALDFIETAQRLIDFAAEKLCSVEGFADEWNSTTDLYYATRELWHNVEKRQAELEHDRGCKTGIGLLE